MGRRSSIEWTETTWNPTTGCDRISPGCDHCYALTLAKRLKAMGSAKYQNDGDPRTSGPGFGVTFHEDVLSEPLQWRKPRRVFVNSMSDVAHARVSDTAIARVFAVMAAARQHTFQVLTKRPRRLARLLSSSAFRDDVRRRIDEMACDASYPLRAEVREHLLRRQRAHPQLSEWPLLNVWIGTSIESDEYCWRAGELRRTPAAIRFLSLEPLLGPLPSLDLTEIDWVIVGGESGPGARPMHPDWARSLRDQCRASDVAFLFKQWGEHLPVPIVDDPAFSGGRAFDDPRGGRSAVVIKERAPAKNHFRGGITRPMEPGEENGLGRLLDRDTIAVRVGKKAAGRELDGRTWDQYPTPDPKLIPTEAVH